MSYDFNYYYTREYIEEYFDWNINNPERVDGEGNRVYLPDEVTTALPGKNFEFFAGYDQVSDVKFCFEEELSTEDKTTLDTVVYNHKNNL